MRTRQALGLSLFAIVVLLRLGTSAAPAVQTAQVALSVQVTDDVAGEAAYGSTVTFTYTVRNTGDDTLTAVTVDDSLAGHLGDMVMLGPGESRTFSARVVIAGEAAGGTGTCSAAGTSTLGLPVVATTDYAVDAYFADDVADYAVSLQALTPVVESGGTVRYRLRVRVASAGILGAVTLVDDYDERLVSVARAGGARAEAGKLTWAVPESLYAGESFVAECSFRLKPGASGTLVNRAGLVHEGGADLDARNDVDRATVRIASSGAGRPGEAGSGTASGGNPDERDAADAFLPFTGPPNGLAALVWAFGLGGYALRRLSV